ncbi:MAG: D-alanine--D-alanine ligase [candidate division Zixibacteria bacterium]|nr:D-alanine--D-alanine ligase [candidate division Zixibacteria bacterium]
MKIVVLAGGESAEREVSLESGQAVAAGLKALGHQAILIDLGNDRRRLEMFARGQLAIDSAGQLLVPASDTVDTDTTGRLDDYTCVFIALHGGIGENGILQALLDLTGMKYTGSGVTASALAMDKYRSKLLFESVGIPTPELIFFGDVDQAAAFGESRAAEEIQYPVVVKPNQQGSTIGLTIVGEYSALNDAIRQAAKYDKGILIERFISGRELTVAILGGEALPVVEIVPKSGFYDYQAKYTAGESEYVCPAELGGAVADKIKDYALSAYQVLDCCGYARVDFRMNEVGELFCLELNTLPGMTSTSLVPKAAQAAGINFEKLLERIIELAIGDERR